jgi:hypothetical protein
MIFYNWAKIYEETNGSPDLIVTLMAYIIYPTLPRNKYDITYKLSLEDWSGDSFLRNPEPIIANRSKFQDRELAQYVALASFRSFAEYQATTKLSLRWELSPVSSKIINNNRLLSLVNNEIFFRWEEVTH